MRTIFPSCPWLQGPPVSCRILYVFFLAILLFCSACGAKKTASVRSQQPASIQKISPAQEDSKTSSTPARNKEQADSAHAASPSSSASVDSSQAQEEEWTDDDYLLGDLEDDYLALDDNATAPQEDTSIADPLEPFNRAMFAINDKLYFWILKPGATVYASVVPRQMRQGISNVFYNLGFPIRFVSNVLQFKLDKAFKETGAFFMNTTFGLGGLVRISDHIEPLKDLPPEDLGQALAYYGVGEGFYIVWPVLGPATLRTTVGRVGEYFLDPVNYLDNREARWAIKGEEVLNEASLHLGDYEDLKKAAFDPYEALKDFYIQHRRHISAMLPRNR